MAVELRAIKSTEVDDLIVADTRGFSSRPPADSQPRTWAEGELDRTRVAFEDGAMVGVSRAYSFELTMPGGALVPAAAVSWVSVLPTHRRRGILTAMISALHADARERGEPLAMLTASESVIYGRFGYGIATWRLGLTMERARTRLARPVNDNGRVRMVTRDEAGKTFPAIYEQVRVTRPGMVSRPDFWWPSVYFGWILAPEKATFTALHEDADGRPDGFVTYEITEDEWTGGIPKKRLLVWDLQTTNTRARAALWDFVLNIDLVETISVTSVPIDEPLRHLVADPRRVRVDFLNDGLWIAPLDVPATLASRTYSVGDELVLDVDGVRVALDGGPEGAEVTETTRDPDLSCPRSTLGACLLGGTRWNDLAQAGLVSEHTSGALVRADLMFMSTPPAAMTSYF